MIQRLTAQKKRTCNLSANWTTADSVSNGEIKKPEIKKSGKVCPKLRNSKCEFGFRGEKCPYEHPKVCKKFLKNGKFEWGCHEEKCPKLHIRLCKSSYRYRTCFNEKCSCRHLPKTTRKPDMVRNQVQHPAPWIREPPGYGRSQTWLGDAIDDKEINIPGYNIFRCDRVCEINPNFPHGGALCYIKDNLVVDNVNKFSNGKCEVLTLTIPKLSLSLLVVYRPPRTNPDKFQEAIDFCQGIINDLPNDKLLAVMGDFNFPKEVITWTRSEYGGMVGHVHGITSDDTKSANVMVNFMNDIASVQHVMTPARGTNILDLFFTNDNHLVENVETLRNTSVSDHDSIYITTNLVKTNIRCNSNPSTNKTPFDSFNFQKADWEKSKTCSRRI